MQTAIQSPDFVITDALNLFIKDQIRKTMRGPAEHVEKLTIRLKDINGSKGGKDKECCVEIKLAEQAPVVVIKRNSNAYASIRSALVRASRTTLRRIQKRRFNKRHREADKTQSPESKP
ncbi:MAG: hypothetical protein ACRBHB_24670 [Arenicella sp.]